MKLRACSDKTKADEESKDKDETLKVLITEACEAKGSPEKLKYLLTDQKLKSGVRERFATALGIDLKQDEPEAVEEMRREWRQITFLGVNLDSPDSQPGEKRGSDQVSNAQSGVESGSTAKKSRTSLSGSTIRKALPSAQPRSQAGSQDAGTQPGESSSAPKKERKKLPG